MKMEWEQHRSGTVVSISGDVVADDMDVFRRQCESQLCDGIRIVMDLREVDRLDSAALEGMLWLHESVQRLGGQLRVVAGGGQPTAAMHVTRVDRRLSMHQSIESAARSFSRGQAA